MDDPILLWLIKVYNCVIQTLWFVYLLIRQVCRSVLRLVPAEPSTIYGGSTVLLAVQSADKLAVNRSTEETIRASGDFGWSLSTFHCKIN